MGLYGSLGFSSRESVHPNPKPPDWSWGVSLLVPAMAKSKVNLSLWCALVLLWTGCTWADFQADLNECQTPLQKLTSCLDFVGGHSKAPTNECCTNVKQVRTTKPKCLCVLIKDSNNPQLALPINQTLALQMPDLCKLDAKLSDCPAILHLSPSSPEAKIFEGSNSSSASPSSSAGSTSKSTPEKAAPATTTGSASFGLSLKPRTGLIGFLILAAAPL